MKKNQSFAVSPEQAIHLAKVAIQQRNVDLGGATPATEKRANRWIVTFSKGTAFERQTNYVARAWVNSDTGKIEEVEDPRESQAAGAQLSPPATRISCQQAIIIAKQTAASYNIDVSKSTPTTELRAGLWIVTFPTNLGTNVRGPAFFARVYVNAETGVAEEILGGD